MIDERPIRVLHCPATVGGNPQQLARAERAVGLASRCVALYPSHFGTRPDEVLFDRDTPRMVKELRRFGLFWRAARGYDVVHFNFGRGLFGVPQVGASVATGASRIASVWREFYCSVCHLRELPILKRLGKGIVVTYQGDDARQVDYCRAHYAISYASHLDRAAFSSKDDGIKRKSIAVFARYADRIFANNPDLLAVLPSSANFQPYASVDLDEWRPRTPPSSDGPVRIIHAPTDRMRKGTEFVIAAVQKLQRDGIPLTFSLVENRLRCEAREVYEDADLLIDQLLVGWYGGVSLEFMALGKPVVCYIRDSDLVHIPPAMRRELPVISATPSDLYQVLRSLLTERRHRLPELGARARRFAERWHDPRAIASEMMRTYASIVNRPRLADVDSPKPHE
jgi:glycosyltransferase involved in cell wall biosynthesis